MYCDFFTEFIYLFIFLQQNHVKKLLEDTKIIIIVYFSPVYLSELIDQLF